MTTEIIIMNRQAIALAADSATTVTHWVDGKEERRFFKGANKIFELSAFQPVGGMIYGNAALHDVPWDLIAKAFRDDLGRKAFNDIPGYSQELFSFIKDHAHLIPKEQRREVLLDEIMKVVFYILYSADKSEILQKVENTAEKGNAYRVFLDGLRQDLAGQSLPECLSPDCLEIARATHGHAIATRVNAFIDHAEIEIDVDFLCNIAIEKLFKDFDILMEKTGLVIAGYGDHDYFPCYHEFSCYGILLEDFVKTSVSNGKIAADQPSYIKAFAQTDMVDTFVVGIGRDVYGQITSQNESMLRTFAAKISSQLSADSVPNIDELIKATHQEYAESLWPNLHENHSWPLRRVIGSLPIDEMASLAENLVNLQSLKEKVTKPTESVAGPIDVAVISKHDGFVWIKRKHYFDASINARYFRRQTAKHGV